MNPTRVLIFPCGAENALELHAALSYCVNIEVWGASSREDHGRFLFKNYIGGLPFIQSRDFLEILNQSLLKHKIDVMFPTHDTVAQFLTAQRHRIGCRVIASDSETADICRSKRRTYDLLADCSFIPRRFPSINTSSDFPMFLKPDIGEGSKGTRLIRNREEGLCALELQPDALLVEYLPGNELTVDCFTDRHSKLRFIGPRERNRVNYGISVHSSSKAVSSEIQEIAQEINRRLHFRGLWFFQLKEATTGQLKLLEISTRAAGTMCLYRHQGVNLPLLSVYDAMDQEIEVLQNDFPIEVDRALFNRFQLSIEYDVIYLDFDDTLLCHGKVNRDVLLLLYQAAQQGRQVYLVTRHAKNIHETLARLCVHPGLFTSIQTLAWNEEKHKLIPPGQKAIFIDNAFVERKKVRDLVGIPVFDVDAVSCLLDWRD